MTTQVQALRGFDHNGRRRRGETFGVPDHQAQQLARSGLVRLAQSAPTPAQAANPSLAAGEKPSASPAAPASREKTAKPSARGAKAQTSAPAPASDAAPSSSPTPPSAPAPGPMSSTPSTEDGGKLI